MLKPKATLIIPLKKGRLLDHPRYVVKGVWQQLWEIVRPWAFFVLGLALGYMV